MTLPADPERGLIAVKIVDGVEGSVCELTFGRGRLCVGRPGAGIYDDSW